MGYRRYPGARRRGSWLGGLIAHDPQLGQILVLFLCLCAYVFYATGQLEASLDALRERLASLVPLAIDAGLALLGLLALVALLFAAGVLRLAPGGAPPRGDHLVLGRARRGFFAVRPAERAAHLTVVGLSGTGKSKAVASWVAQDILRGRDTAIVLDIHRALIEDVLGQVGDHVAARDGLVLEAGHPRWAYGFDPLWCAPGDRPELRAAAAARVWQTVYGERWSDRIEYYLRSTFQAVIEGGWTILEAPRLLDDRDFRTYVRERCRSDGLRDFFRTYEAKRQGQQAEEIASVQVRLQEFTSDPLLRALLGPAVRDEQYLRHRRAALPGYAPRVLDLPALVEDGRAILLDFPYQALGENSKLLAGMTLAALLDLFLRRDLAGARPRQVNLWADELQHYATDAVATLYTQTRKFGLSFCAVCTGLGYLPRPVREALLGAGVLVAFQTLTRDAQELAPEMFRREFERVKYQPGGYADRAPVYYQDREILAEQVDWLNKARPRECWVYARRRGGDAVRLRTLDVRPRLGPAERAAVRAASGARYGNALADVEAELRLRYRWLDERRYRLTPRERPRRPAAPRAAPIEPPPPAREAEARRDPFA